jgi:leader peptidase (prepilin peptidase)/N-methyltransferase
MNQWTGDGWLAPLICAPFLGSFAGVLIDRVPSGRGFVWGRSACPACGHALGMAELVPIASFVALRGRCRHCGAAIPRACLWVELAFLGIAVWAASCGARGALLWASCALGWTLLTLGWIDSLCLRLPDFLTLPLILGGLAEAALLEPDALTARALGAAIGYSLFRLLAYAYLRLRGREGLGMGDAKLVAAGGAWVGVWALPDLVLVGSGLALVYMLRKLRIERSQIVPFGPFLASAIWLLWLYG